MIILELIGLALLVVNTIWAWRRTVYARRSWQLQKIRFEMKMRSDDNDKTR